MIINHTFFSYLYHMYCILTPMLRSALGGNIVNSSARAKQWVLPNSYLFVQALRDLMSLVIRASGTVFSENDKYTLK